MGSPTWRTTSPASATCVLWWTSAGWGISLGSGPRIRSRRCAAADGCVRWVSGRLTSGLAGGWQVAWFEDADLEDAADQQPLRRVVDQTELQAQRRVADQDHFLFLIFPPLVVLAVDTLDFGKRIEEPHPLVGAIFAVGAEGADHAQRLGLQILGDPDALGPPFVEDDLLRLELLALVDDPDRVNELLQRHRQAQRTDALPRDNHAVADDLCPGGRFPLGGRPDR